MEPTKKNVSDWKELFKLYEEKFSPIKKNNNKPKTWIFRGDNPYGMCSGGIDPSIILKSKIDKAFDFFSIEKNERLFREKYLFRDFCRKQFLYSNYEPKSNLERLSLMRHHEGPTRLMDWTYSFFVAVYFAINRAEKCCVVWAIDEDWIDTEKKNLHKKLYIDSKKPEDKDYTWYNEAVLKRFWSKCFWKTCIGDNRYFGWVYPMTSFYLNKRITLQRGLFLCQADIRIPWYENLKEMAKESQRVRDMAKDSENSLFYQIKIEWDDKKDRDTIINSLFEMNINQATLFPDLDGFAMSLRTKLASPQCFPRPEDLTIQ